MASLVTEAPKKGGLQEFMACPNMYRIAIKIMHISGILGGHTCTSFSQWIGKKKLTTLKVVLESTWELTKNCANEIWNPEPDHFPGLNSWEACTQQATAQAHSLSFAIGCGLGVAPLNLPKTNMTPKEKGFEDEFPSILW